MSTATIEEAFVASHLAVAHARLGLDNQTLLSVSYGESGARWNVYGHLPPPIGFVCESAATLEEAAQKYKAATDKETVAAKLRAQADRFISEAMKMEGTQ